MQTGLIFLNNIRDGIFHCSVKKATSVNKSFEKYVPQKPSTDIMYQNATNLYRYSMSQSVPMGEFLWLSQN